MSISIDQFIELLLETGDYTNELKKKCEQVEWHPSLSEILINFSGSQGFKTILNPKRFGEISLAKADIITHVILNYSVDKDWVKLPSYDFLDKLAEAAEKKFSKQNNEEDTKNSKKSIVIGIDLGTTYSVVSILEENKARTITNSEGSRLFPSIVSIDKNGSYVLGSKAKRKMIADPLNTFYSTKRFIGRRSKSITNDEISRYDYQVDLSCEKVKLRCPRKSKAIDIEEISAQVLTLCKEAAENSTNKIVKKCVITVPAYFDDNQRSATKAAAEIAGMEVLRLIAEPTAAAYAFGVQKNIFNENILVADLGGGTFDISLVNFQDSTLTSVVATSGSTKIGGDDFTFIMQNLIRNELNSKYEEFYEDTSTKITLREEAEKAKCALTGEDSTEITLPSLISINNKPIAQPKIEISSLDFNEACKEIYSKIEDLAKEFLKDEKVKNKTIDKLVLAGGASRMPEFRRIFERNTGLNASIDLNPDEVVANGAVLCAELATGYQPQVSIIDVTPLSLGTEVIGDIFAMIIPRNTSLPTEKKSTFTTTEDNQECVNFKVLQGERKVASENTELGNFILDNIEEGEAGDPQLEVTFRIDLDGILTANARDLSTNSFKEIKIKNSLTMKKSKIREMKEEAMKNKEKDDERVFNSNIVNSIREKFKLLIKNIEDKDFNIDKKFTKKEKTSYYRADEILNDIDSIHNDAYEILIDIEKLLNKYFNL